ncbi:MAG TPA: BcsE family c-di-GMP-binding protein, partial [Gallionella sp.]|nr:BcsE family c-di-GMP-binding protein [Gallionella sp.]
MNEDAVPEYLLGIGNLPDVTGKMLAGRLYVVMHDADLGLEVVCRTVVAASASGRVDWLAEVPSAYLGVVPQLGREVADCLREQTLRIFQSTSENPHGMCRRILKDLDLIGVAGGGLVIADGADRFIEEVSDEAWEGDLSAWQKWAERTGCAVLWMCPRRAGQFGHEADLLRMAHRFSGMARLRKSGDELRWDVYYWFGNEGLMLDKSFRLNADDSGSCWVEEHHSVPAGEAELIVDEDEVYIMKAALPAGRSTPSGWRVFDTVEQMSVALSSARAPTVIFHHNPGGSFETLARAVFELRRAIGAYVKIVIKETGGRLRHSHEQLLLSLGANLTIPGETGFVHMLSLLRSI